MCPQISATTECGEIVDYIVQIHHRIVQSYHPSSVDCRFSVGTYCLQKSTDRSTKATDCAYLTEFLFQTRTIHCDTPCFRTSVAGDIWLNFKISPPFSILSHQFMTAQHNSVGHTYGYQPWVKN